MGAWYRAKTMAHPYKHHVGHRYVGPRAIVLLVNGVVSIKKVLPVVTQSAKAIG